MRRTVGKKLETYLVAPKLGEDEAGLYPPLFERIETVARGKITSLCCFRLFDDKERRFDIIVKSNVFNFEIMYCLRLATPPSGYTDDLKEKSYDLQSLKDWSVTTAANPLLALVSATIHGSIAEGYTVYVQARPDESGGIMVTYRLRQKLQSNFLTSPYLRRYFSEDAAIASYIFYAEALASTGSTILGGSTIWEEAA